MKFLDELLYNLESCVQILCGETLEWNRAIIMIILVAGIGIALKSMKLQIRHLAFKPSNTIDFRIAFPVDHRKPLVKNSRLFERTLRLRIDGVQLRVNWHQCLGHLGP